jgi:hypothetical protein
MNSIERHYFDWIDNHRTSKGGYSKELVTSLGISWPLTKGWKQRFAKRKAADPYQFMIQSLQEQYR